MRCVFVLDILNGAVVHAIRGERSRYGPIASFSGLVTSSDPFKVLQSIRPREIYIADLNLLTGKGDNLKAIDEISRSVRTMADTGIKSAADLDRLSEFAYPVLGTETASLDLMRQATLSRKIIVSIDMKKREVLASDPHLSGMTALSLLKELNCLDIEAVILLELDRVGTSSGIDREFLADAIRASRHPLLLGGGVKGEEDLDDLEILGFSGALVSTAVHNGRIPLKRVR